MANITKFRLIVGIYLLLEVLGYFIFESVNSHFPKYLKLYEEQEHQYINEEYKMIFYIVLLFIIITHILSDILLFIPKWIGKYAYAISGVSLYLVSPMYGPVVEHGFTSMISSIASIFFGMSVVYSFILSEKRK